MSVAESIKARLKNRAESEKRTYQEILTIFALERTLFRLSISSYSDQFILKGGILLYALYQGDFTRGTADVDLLGQQITNDLEVIRKVFLQIFSLKCPEDGIQFDLSTLKAERITEFKKYPGINVSIDGFLERTKLSVRIDIGFGDVIYPSKIRMEYPTLLSHQAPILQAYSKESMIAEKFEAIVSHGKANSRIKDFYDIYALLGTFDFDGAVLSEAIKETFSNRKTKLDNIVAFEAGFATDPYRKGMWTSFLKTKKISLRLDFEAVIQKIGIFLNPLIETIQNGSVDKSIWDHLIGEWCK